MALRSGRDRRDLPAHQHATALVDCLVAKRFSRVYKIHHFEAN